MRFVFPRSGSLVGLYIGLVAITRAVVPNVRAALAFSKQALAANVPPTAVVNIASEAEGYAVTRPPVPATGT